MEYLLDINDLHDSTLHNIKLHSPTPIQGGSYLAKITLNGNPILFQMPTCTTKRGVVSSGKRYYCDLLFNYDHTNVIDFIENVEMVIRDKILDKNEIWFQDPPSLEDIEYNWNDSIKQTKQNFYLRTYVGNVKNIEKSVSVYNSNQEKINIDNILPSSNIITIVEITGLKFSSSSFHINYCLRQIMVLEEKKPIFNKCLINVSSAPTNTPSKTIQQEQSQPSIEKTPNVSDPDISNVEQTTPVTTITVNTENNKDLEKTTTNIDTNTNTDTNTDKNTNKKQSIETETETETPTLSSNHLGEKDTDKNTDTTESNETSKTSIASDDDLEILNPLPTQEEKENEIMVETHEQYPDSDTDTENNETSDTVQHLEDSTLRKNISTDVEHLEIKEIDLQIPEEEEDTVQLKKPDTVYLDMYRQALEKAKLAKLKAIQAYLELKEIKNKYMIEEVEDDDDNFDDLDYDI